MTLRVDPPCSMIQKALHVSAVSDHLPSFGAVLMPVHWVPLGVCAGAVFPGRLFLAPGRGARPRG
eukprot:10417882-Prorocentrum_lima.AAC.1